MITHYAEEGIVAIDTHYLKPRLDASHLLIRDGQGMIIDCGTSFSVPYVLDGISACGLAPSDIKYLFITHVHLDHAGGAGKLMSALPNAKLLVHPRGARHLVDPTKLWAGATEVYGPEAMKELYGSMEPIQAERVIETNEGDHFTVGGSTLEVLHTPGHAKHHHALWEPATRSIFTGDTFGLAYPSYHTHNGAFIFPTTTPVHFDPKAMHSSITRFMKLDPRAAFLTHYGRVRSVQKVGEILLKRLEQHVAIAENARKLPANKQKDAIKQELTTELLKSLQSHGVLEAPPLSLEWWETDLELNAQGLTHWLSIVED